jgi:DNA-binding GntR family transcriptional regulator
MVLIKMWGKTMTKHNKKTLNIKALAVKEPLSSRVYREIKRALLDGQFAPGELLPEDSLTDATGASRTPVREALMRLQGEGLVRIVPRKGARVSAMDEDELRELVETRVLLESAFLERAIEKIPAASISEIKRKMNAIISEMETMDTDSSAWSKKRLEYSKLDFKFHRMLVKAADNRFLLKYYDEVLERVILYSHHTIIKYPLSFMQSAKEHDDILTAIINRDTTEVKKLISNHLKNLNTRLR